MVLTRGRWKSHYRQITARSCSSICGLRQRTVWIPHRQDSGCAKISMGRIRRLERLKQTRTCSLPSLNVATANRTRKPRICTFATTHTPRSLYLLPNTSDTRRFSIPETNKNWLQNRNKMSKTHQQQIEKAAAESSYDQDNAAINSCPVQGRVFANRYRWVSRAHTHHGILHLSDISRA